MLNILGTPGANQTPSASLKDNQLKVSVTASPVRRQGNGPHGPIPCRRYSMSRSHDIEVVFGRFNVNKQLRIRSPKKLPSVINKHFSVPRYQLVMSTFRLKRIIRISVSHSPSSIPALTSPYFQGIMLPMPLFTYKAVREDGSSVDGPGHGCRCPRTSAGTRGPGAISS